MLRIIGKSFGSISASQKIKEGKKHGKFSYRDILDKMENKKRALINDLRLREASRIALQCWKLTFQHYKCPLLHYDLSRKVHILHYNFHCT